MPFVLGDDGITYQKVDDLKVGDVTYPGYKISYGDGVGDSPKDNYFPVLRCSIWKNEISGIYGYLF